MLRQCTDLDEKSMPHFENDTMGENTVNGERAQSQFLEVGSLVQQEHLAGCAIY